MGEYIHSWSRFQEFWDLEILCFKDFCRSLQRVLVVQTSHWSGGLLPSRNSLQQVQRALTEEVRSLSGLSPSFFTIPPSVFGQVLHAVQETTDTQYKNQEDI